MGTETHGSDVYIIEYGWIMKTISKPINKWVQYDE